MPDFGVLGVSTKKIFADDVYGNVHVAEALLDKTNLSAAAVAERALASSINWFNYNGSAVSSVTADSLLILADSTLYTVDKG